MKMTTQIPALKVYWWIVGKKKFSKTKFLMFFVNVKIFNALSTNKFKPRFARGFSTANTNFEVLLVYKYYPSDVAEFSVRERAECNAVRFAEVSDSLEIGVKLNISAGIKGIFK